MGVRNWALSLSLVLVAGCTPAAAPSQSAAPAVDWSDRGPITFAVASGTSGTWQSPIDRWNSDHPNEQVTLTEVPRSNGDELASRGESSSGDFTMFAMDPSWTAEFAEQDWLAPLPAELFPTDELVPATLPAATWNEQLYAYPIAVDATMLYYDKGAVAKSAVPSTWDEVDEVCRQSTQDASGCLITPLGAPEDLATAVAEIVWANDGSLTPGSAVGLDSAAVSFGVERYASGLASGWMPKGALDWTPQRSERAFSSGRSVFYRGWWSESHALGLDQAKPRVALTQVPDGTSAGVSVLGGQNLGVSANGQNLGTAAAVINYLASAEVQQERATQSAAGPVRNELYQDSKLTAALPRLKALELALKSAEPLPGEAKSRDLVSEVDASIRPALAGTTSVSSSLTDLESRLERLA